MELDEYIKQERLNFFVRLTERCVDVLAMLDMKDLRTRYAFGDGSSLLDYYLFTYLSDRTLFLEVVAKFNSALLDKVGSYCFTSNPEFEKIIEKYTKTNKKPNLVLEKNRPWDVAINLVMKVEALKADFTSYFRRLLKREFEILDHLWLGYLKENLDFDDMTGIPMVFDFNEVPNSGFVLGAGTPTEEIDLYGRLVQRKVIYPEPTLSYMTMEKLGPSLSYVIDLMGMARRQSVGLNISSALKVFDQLVCRLITIHRFGVLHNGICPQNIYFGRSLCYNVIYLNNFRAATLATSQPGIKTVINMRVAKDVRFASLNMMKSTDMHPVDDIESAFYTLLACIGCNLPWDSLLQPKQDSSLSDTTSVTSLESGHSKTSPSVKFSSSVKKTESRQFYNSIQAAKVAFWESNIHLERYLANLMHRLSDRDAELFSLIAGVLQDLYSKVKRIISTYSNSKNSAQYCSQLCRGSSLLQLYTELRKPGLMLFNFEVEPAFLKDLTYQNRQKTLAHGVSHLLIGWDLSEWCFNSVEIRLPNLKTGRTSRISRLPS